MHQQYVFSLYESADCCGRLQKLASHRFLGLLYLNVNFVSHEHTGTTLVEFVESAAHRTPEEPPSKRLMLPSAGAKAPTLKKKKLSISHVALTFQRLISVPVLPKYSPRPYPAVLLTTRTDVATPAVSPHASPLMQPVTVPGELPFSVTLRFSKAKVKLPPGQFGTEASKQEVVVLVVEAVVVVVVAVVVEVVVVVVVAVVVEVVVVVVVAVVVEVVVVVVAVVVEVVVVVVAVVVVEVVVVVVAVVVVEVVVVVVVAVVVVLVVLVVVLVGWRRRPSNVSLIFLIFQILNGIPSLPCRSLPSCRKSVVMFGSTSSVSSITLFLGSA